TSERSRGISSSLRRHDPDQVRWVGGCLSARVAPGHPIEIAGGTYRARGRVFKCAEGLMRPQSPAAHPHLGAERASLHHDVVLADHLAPALALLLDEGG